MDIQLVVFDLDGTLVGAPMDFAEVKERLRERLEKEGISKELIGDLTPMYETLLKISQITGMDFEYLHSFLVELEVERAKDSYLFEGSRELLELLKENGIKIALMTRSSRKATEYVLKKHDIEEFFDLVVTRDDVPPEDVKPNPGHLKTILEHFNVPPTKVVVVGDHGYDLLPAKELRCLSVLITSNESGRMSFKIEEDANFEVMNVKEAIELFKRLLKTYVVVPAYNEEKTIGNVLRDLLQYFRGEEIVVVNDGSRDRTRELAQEKGVVVLTHLVNRGLGGALGTGIRYALLKGAELILTFDADGQHLVDDALRVMKPVAEGKADFAVGSRLKGDVSEMPFVKRFGNFVLDFITAVFAKKYVSDSQSGLRCLNRECASKIKITCDRYAVSSEIIIEASKNGCRIVEVPIKAVYTEYSKKKGTNILEGVKIAFNLLLDRMR
ncbi:bifunctional phosphatase/dolichol-phosphate glucosyltransferase [Thermococcus litoralis DSM 5473]|uniref:Bifunctional phosphatase/dolichol-phosphate glucosyltransferase n=1 Tax=Thermococcus litoralis (strain ATCC 51850 / DSM 5473 / JCM 8560 / NS-C) TaxID=523849 RepID=H3ZLX9_THELN|nr:HAD-IA family hydrolase [Thermococcus litoralis]EHR79037.1 bifunctional phosphatase/dolichol-phosphate glucosyltransferase [Thermococcus litoralis DSM 5473]